MRKGCTSSRRRGPAIPATGSTHSSRHRVAGNEFEQLVQDHLDDPLAPFPVAPSRNLGRPELVPVAELANDCGIDLRLPALVHATRLCCGNAFGLPFLSQVGFNVIVSL